MNGMLTQFPTTIQEESADFPGHSTLFLSGPASSGKTSTGLLRLQNILTNSSNAKLLVLLPQRSLSEPYHQLLRELNLSEGELVSVQTMSSLVRRMISLFWPIISSHQVFKHPFEAPRFLTLETSQYYMQKSSDP